MPNTEPTNAEIQENLLQAIQSVEKNLSARMDNFVTKREWQDMMETINAFASDTEERFVKIENKMDNIESKMVTKDYLDIKIANLHADLVVLARKSNTKLTVLIENLVEQKALTPDIAQKILALEPFPQQ